MSLVLHQAPDDGTNGIVTPESDARLYALATANACGIVQGVQVSSIGGSSLQVSSGWGIIYGRCFSIEQETLLAGTSTDGSKKGRLILKIDLSAAEQPIKFVTQVADELSELVQENLNEGGAIYELPLAEYSVDEVSVSNLVNVTPKAQSLGASLSSLKTDVNNLRYVTVTLPVSGWSGSAPYTQTVTVSGMTADWKPGTPTLPKSDTSLNVDTCLAELEALRCINACISSTNALTFVCFENRPETTITIDVPGQLKKG